MSEVIKAVKQYSSDITKDTIEIVKNIGTAYRNAKNYFYSRFSGVYSIEKVNSHKKLIRDEFMKEKNFLIKQFGDMPARYWKICLDDAVSGIKSMWSNSLNKCREAVRNNTNLTDEEKHLIYYIFKNPKELQAIMNYKEIDYKNIEIVKKENKKKKKKKEVTYPFKEYVIREKYVYNLIRRYIRRYKSEIPKSSSLTFQLDADMYSYKGGQIEIQTFEKGKRIKIGLRDNIKYSGNKKIIIKKNDIEIHSGVKIKTKGLNNAEKIIGVDKGYKRMITISSGKFYGENLGEILEKETERLNSKNKKRNPYYARIRNYEKEIENLTAGNNPEKELKIKTLKTKINNMKNNNIGKIKYDNQKQKNRAYLESYVNRELNRFIIEEKPKQIVTEDLSWTANKDKGKKINRKLSSWIKGYIQERIDYKAELYEIKQTTVNPAYTSQTCRICGSFGKRNGTEFVCPVHGKMDADVNASYNILKRLEDKQITIYTPHKTVKEIIEKRNIVKQLIGVITNVR